MIVYVSQHIINVFYHYVNSGCEKYYKRDVRGLRKGCLCLDALFRSYNILQGRLGHNGSLLNDFWILFYFSSKLLHLSLWKRLKMCNTCSGMNITLEPPTRAPIFGQRGLQKKAHFPKIFWGTMGHPRKMRYTLLFSINKGGRQDYTTNIGFAFHKYHIFTVITFFKVTHCAPMAKRLQIVGDPLCPMILTSNKNILRQRIYVSSVLFPQVFKPKYLFMSFFQIPVCSLVGRCI